MQDLILEDQENKRQENNGPDIVGSDNVIL